ncbi:hypothetical protein OH76DRAFT_906917 [Lentinus brumalis]|uniref:Uncharacterized protein n=1 Tax=Lentinus brumalis TaxID=2498619 RepID=A0A371D0J7_9APHY|nr:hypothetical protein OH76DRAFT_906917 [Polyporus brumalis]
MSQSSSPFAQSSNHYEAMARKVDAMLECAADIGDETLFLRAQEYLCILEHEEYTALNRPACLDGLIARGQGMSRGRPSPDFSIKVLFEAMLRVTDELGMASANRYISAAVCVCVAREDSSDVLVGAEAAHGVQAARLSYLGVVWIAYALWPFVANTGSRMPDREDDYEFPVDPTTTNVLSRDGFRCCMTGHPDWCIIKQANEMGYDTNFAARRCTYSRRSTRRTKPRPSRWRSLLSCFSASTSVRPSSSTRTKRTFRRTPSLYQAGHSMRSTPFTPVSDLPQYVPGQSAGTQHSH